MRNGIPTAASAALLLFGGCIPRSVTVRAASGVIAGGLSAVYEEADLNLAGEALPAQLKMMEVLLKSDPGNPVLLKSLAEGYVGYAYLFLEDTDPDRAAALYGRAAGYGQRLLEDKTRFRGLAAAGAQAAEAMLSTARPADVPGLYWTAYALAGRANMAKNDAAALASLPNAVRMMRKVMELDPGYHYSGADLFFGTYYAGRPKMAGGDPEKAKAHFESALSRTGRKNLLAQLLYAQYYAAAVLDEELFRSLMEEIGNAPQGLLPEASLTNAAAKNKSNRLLERIDEIF